MSRPFLFFVIAGLAAILTVAPAHAQTDWTVKLTRKQAKAFAEVQRRPGHVGFAISPSGAWGFAEARKTPKQAAEDALDWCRAYVVKGKPDCVVYAVDGKVVAPATVRLKIISEVYKPVDAARAAAWYGLAPLNFQGNSAAAVAAYKAVEKNPEILASIPRDKRLMSGLTGRSIATKQGRFSVLFVPGGARQVSKSNGGLLGTNFGYWVATPDGLICMTQGVWDNGKAAGTRCLILHAASQGQLSVSWAATPNSKQTGYLVAGDAGIGRAR